MKNVVKISLVLMFIPLLFSCQTNKQIVNSDKESEILYQQALKALEEQKFVIEAYEFRYPSQNVVKTSIGSFVSMQGHKAEINFTSDIFPKSRWVHLVIIDPEAILTKEKVKKQSDLYKLTMKGDRRWLDREVLITLYKNTNQCDVQVYETNTGSLLISFKGYLYPREEKNKETGF